MVDQSVSVSVIVTLTEVDFKLSPKVGALTRSIRFDKGDAKPYTEVRRAILSTDPAVNNTYFSCPLVSRHHAVIECDMSTYTITVTDKKSSHGTYILDAQKNLFWEQITPYEPYVLTKSTFICFGALYKKTNYPPVILRIQWTCVKTSSSLKQNVSSTTMSTINKSSPNVQKTKTSTKQYATSKSAQTAHRENSQVNVINLLASSPPATPSPLSKIKNVDSNPSTSPTPQLVQNIVEPMVSPMTSPTKPVKNIQEPLKGSSSARLSAISPSASTSKAGKYGLEDHEIYDPVVIDVDNPKDDVKSKSNPQGDFKSSQAAMKSMGDTVQIKEQCTQPTVNTENNLIQDDNEASDGDVELPGHSENNTFTDKKLGNITSTEIQRKNKQQIVRRFDDFCFNVVEKSKRAIERADGINVNDPFDGFKRRTSIDEASSDELERRMQFQRDQIEAFFSSLEYMNVALRKCDVQVEDKACSGYSILPIHPDYSYRGSRNTSLKSTASEKTKNNHNSAQSAEYVKTSKKYTRLERNRKALTSFKSFWVNICKLGEEGRKYIGESSSSFWSADCEKLDRWIDRHRKRIESMMDLLEDLNSSLESHGITEKDKTSGIVNSGLVHYILPIHPKTLLRRWYSPIMVSRYADPPDENIDEISSEALEHSSASKSSYEDRGDRSCESLEHAQMISSVCKSSGEGQDGNNPDSPKQAKVIATTCEPAEKSQDGESSGHAESTSCKRKRSVEEDTPEIVMKRTRLNKSVISAAVFGAVIGSISTFVSLAALGASNS